MEPRRDLLALVALAGVATGQSTARVSVDSNGVQANEASRGPAISADGRVVAFQSSASNLVAGDTNTTGDVFVHDVATGLTTRVSVDPSGAQYPAFSDCGEVSVSASGRYVAYFHWEFLVTFEVFRHDRTTGQTALVSAAIGGGPSNGGASAPAISASGRYVAFLSSGSDLAPGDSDPNVDCFVRDMNTGMTTLVSVSSAGVKGNGHSEFPSRIAISGDGTRVVFKSSSTNLVPGDANNTPDLFLRDLETGTTSLVSSGLPQGFDVGQPKISGDGRFVAFETNHAFDPLDTNGVDDVYVRELATGAIERASVSTTGAQGNGASRSAAISGDGRVVAFVTEATTLFAGDSNGVQDVLVRDRLAGTTVFASTDSSGAFGDGWSSAPSVSANGFLVAYASAAANLVAGDTNVRPDVFRHQTACTGSIATYCSPKTNSLGCVPSIGSTGTPSRTGPDDFHVTATNVRNRKLGILFWSRASASAPFAGGLRCVETPIVRTPRQGSGGSATGDDCTGAYDFHFAQGYLQQQGLAAGATVYAQYWSRDPGFAPPDNLGLTAGLRFTVCP